MRLILAAMLARLMMAIFLPKRTQEVRRNQLFKIVILYLLSMFACVWVLETYTFSQNSSLFCSPEMDRLCGRQPGLTNRFTITIIMMIISMAISFLDGYGAPHHRTRHWGKAHLRSIKYVWVNKNQVRVQIISRHQFKWKLWMDSYLPPQFSHLLHPETKPKRNPSKNTSISNSDWKDYRKKKKNLMSVLYKKNFKK